MDVRIVEAGHDELFVQIDYARVWADQGFDIGGLFGLDRHR